MTDQHARRRWAVPLAAAALTAALACTKPPAAGCAPGAPPVALPAGSPWAGKLCRQASQKPPVMTNGVLARDGILWIAGLGGEIVAAEAATGEIVGRFGPDQGVTSGPDDLAMAADGTLYWTGFTTGEIGVLSPDTGRSRTLARLRVGANPIALAPDGSLLVGHAYLGKGLVRIDTTTGSVRELDPGVAVNGFAFGPDGALYAPRTDTLPARVVRVDPGTGQVTTVTPDVGLAAAGLEFPTPARGDAPTTAYVLLALPPVVRRIDIGTGQRVGADITVPFAVVDNLTFSTDGTLYVTANITPQVFASGADGSTRTITIGRR